MRLLAALLAHAAIGFVIEDLLDVEDTAAVEKIEEDDTSVMNPAWLKDCLNLTDAVVDNSTFDIRMNLCGGWSQKTLRENGGVIPLDYQAHLRRSWDTLETPTIPAEERIQAIGPNPKKKKFMFCYGK
jgi:hypothetical protein